MKMEQAHEETSLIPRLLAGLAGAVCRCPWLVLSAGLILCGISVYAACTHLEYRTQRSDLMDPTKECQKHWRKYLEEFGNDDDMVVVVQGQGANRQRMKDALETLASEVRCQPKQFDRLYYKADFRALRNRALLYLPQETIRQIQENLRPMHPLLESPLGLGWRVLTLQSLLHEACVRADKLRPGQPLAPADEQFLTQLLAISRSASATLDDPSEYYNPWASLIVQQSRQQDLLAEPQYFFSDENAAGKTDDDCLAFLLVRPIQEEGSFTGANKSVEVMRGILDRVQTRFPELQIGLTGLPVLENDEMVASEKDTNLASWLALAGVALLYLIVFRSFRYPLLTVGTLLVGTAWALGWLTLTVGHLNILSATFAVMLIGMGDYGVLWVTRYELERVAGTDVPTALRRTAASVGPGILTAATTAALAFFATMLADFQAVSELGWIAGWGVLLCAFSCFTIMPALLLVVDRRERPAPMQSIPLTRHAAWLPALTQRPRWVIGVSGALTAVLALFACNISYDHNLLHLQAQGLDSVRWEMKLIEHTAGASWHALSYTGSQAEALALKVRYEQLPEVSRVVEVASLVPAHQEPKLAQLRDIQHRLRHLPPRGAVIPHSLPRFETLQRELALLIQRLESLSGSGPALLANLKEAAQTWQATIIRHTQTKKKQTEAAERLRQFEQRMAGDLAEDLHRLRDVSTPERITLADIPLEWRERYVSKSGKWLLRVFGKKCLWEYAPLEEFARQIHRVDPQATGKPFSTLEGLREMKHGFEWAGIYALGAIVLVLLGDFRRLLPTALALVPLGMGVVVSLGIMTIFGLPLNPANMIAFPLIVGVGVDNGVHVLHDYLSHPSKRQYALSHATGRGIMVAALTTVLGFGTLMISSHRGLVGLGLILTLGVSCCMLSALIFLPAVLRVWNQRKVAIPSSTSQRQAA